MSLTNKLILPGAIAIAVLIGVAGGSVLSGLNANAAAGDPSTATSTSTNSTSTPHKDESKGGHIGSNGKSEVLLTGDTASKVKEAALAVVSGGTIQRVENDVDGQGTYEAHMLKSDGSQVTVFLDANYKVLSVQSGPGPRPGSSDSTSSSTN